MPQWVLANIFARRGGAEFAEDKVKASRCPLLAWHPHNIVVEGRQIGAWFEVDKQPEAEAAAIKALKCSQTSSTANCQYLVDDLDPLGHKIIECCLNNGTLSDYAALIDHPTLKKA